jgi:CheY-like chemotaxis protein
MIVVLGYVIHRLLVWPLLRARVAADAASAAKSEFLASMSHEIRTPMNGVLGMAEVLLNSDLNDHQRELASIIVSSGQALMTVINDILDFSKLEAGKLRLTPRSFNLRQTVYEIATMMQARALEKDLELIVRYAPNLPEGVVADEARLRQVLGNLIGNAVKFTDKGHVLIDISGERAGEAMNIQVSITDTGIGIEPAEIPRMFEKFEQADGSHTRRHGGTGLGLAICKNIIELMQGEIGADSEPDKGSRFWFKITAPVDGKVKAIPAIAEAVFDNVRLLAVDDNAVNRRVIDELTNGWGLRATTVGGAKEAMAALERSIAESDRYHAVLMDYQMPGEDGVALTRRIQADPRFAAIPVIMLSSIDPTHAGAGVKEVRLAAHLHKPVRPSQLMDILARVLLDRAATTLTRAARALKNEPERVRDVSSGDRVKVLLAEDNVVNQLVIQNMIGAEEYEVIVAENGQAAVDLFLKHKPSVVLMDISMPVMDGLEAARRIRDIESEQGLHRTPIIAATAHVLEQDRERCRLAGMDDFLAKPIRKPKLDEAVSRWARHAARAPRARSA